MVKRRVFTRKKKGENREAFFNRKEDKKRGKDFGKVLKFNRRNLNCPLP